MVSRLRAILLALAGLLFVATWPGAATRAATVELSAPAIPTSIQGRDGILDVVVRGAPRAHVRAFAILDGRAHAAAEADTDAEGRATLRDLPLAEHWVVAEAPGHARASQMVVVVAGPRRVDLELVAEHTLDVDVKDEHGAPMSGVELEVRGTDPFPVGARTDGGGAAHVERLGEGPFTVLARAAGFEDVTRRRVREGERLSIVLGKQGALLVEVLAEDGTPAASARVLLDSSTLGGARVAQTDKDGKVRIAGLEHASYSLRAQLQTRVSPIEIGIVLDKGEERTVSLTLQPGVMVSAHVVDAANEEDVRDARITLAEGGLSPFPIEAVTDKRGHVVLGPILRGPATLSARADGYVPKSAIALDEASAAEVRVPLARGGAVIGKITDARGYAVDGATIRVVGTDLDGLPIDEDPSKAVFRDAHFAANLAGPSALVPAGQLGVMPGPVPAIPHGPSVGLAFDSSTSAPPTGADPWVSGRDGMFRATPIPPGRIRVLIHHPQYVEAMSETVLLESDKEARVDVVLQRGGNLEGRVVDAHGRAVSGAHVTALATRGSLEHLSRTGSDGSFAFAALPDAVTVLVARAEDPTTIVARLEVVIPEAGKKTIEITLPDPRPGLPVKIVDARGYGLEAAQVTAVSLDPGEALRTTAFTDAKGQAELAGGKGIALRIEVRAPGRAARIVLTTPDQPELTVELAPAESLTGEVVTKRREPIPNADVALQTDAGIRHARTDKDGTFTFAEVAAGPARLRVRAAGRAPDERAIVIEALGGRRPTEIKRFELLEEAIVEGVVVDPRGDPIPGARVAKDAVPTYLPVGTAAQGMAVADGKGRFRLGELAEGVISLEAYAADVGRVRRTDVRVNAGRTTDGVKLVITRGEATAKEPIATGGVAITLGETAAGLEAAEVVVVAVSEGSEAERGGLAVNDAIVEVGGVKVASIVDARARLSGPVQDDVLVKVRRGEHVVALRIAREAVRR